MENIYVDFEITGNDLNKFKLILESIIDWSTTKCLDGFSRFSTTANAASILYCLLDSGNFNFVFNCKGIDPDAKNNNKKTNEEKDNVNHPSHYATGKYECIDIMIELYGVEFVKNFCFGNAFKYLYRAKRKNGIEDIQKAVWYLNMYLSLVEKSK